MKKSLEKVRLIKINKLINKKLNLKKLKRPRLRIVLEQSKISLILVLRKLWLYLPLRLLEIIQFKRILRSKEAKS